MAHNDKQKPLMKSRLLVLLLIQDSGAQMPRLCQPQMCQPFERLEQISLLDLSNQIKILRINTTNLKT